MKESFYPKLKIYKSMKNSNNNSILQDEDL